MTPPEPLANTIKGVVIAENNIEAGKKVISILSPPYDIRVMEEMVCVGPPLHFTESGVAEIEFMNCIPNNISPLLDEPYPSDEGMMFKISKIHDIVSHWLEKFDST